MTLLLIWQGQFTPFDPVAACLALAGDNQFLIDCVIYWDAYDQLTTDDERNDLQYAFLLNHGAKWIKQGGQRILTKTMYPVRWCPYQNP